MDALLQRLITFVSYMYVHFCFFYLLIYLFVYLSVCVFKYVGGFLKLLFFSFFYWSYSLLVTHICILNFSNADCVTHFITDATLIWIFFFFTHLLSHWRTADQVCLNRLLLFLFELKVRDDDSSFFKPALSVKEREKDEFQLENESTRVRVLSGRPGESGD